MPSSRKLKRVRKVKILEMRFTKICELFLLHRLLCSSNLSTTPSWQQNRLRSFSSKRTQQMNLQFASTVSLNNNSRHSRQTLIRAGQVVWLRMRSVAIESSWPMRSCKLVATNITTKLKILTTITLWANAERKMKLTLSWRLSQILKLLTLSWKKTIAKPICSLKIKLKIKIIRKRWAKPKISLTTRCLLKTRPFTWKISLKGTKMRSVTLFSSATIVRTRRLLQVIRTWAEI